MNQLLDTNIILYFLGGRLETPLQENNYFCSVITEIELLSYPSLNKENEIKVRAFLSELEILGIENEIKENAIQLRKNYTIKLPDAIIGATALFLNAEILTNDTQFSRIPTLKIKHLKLK